MDSVPRPGPAHLARSPVRISPQPAPHGHPIPSPTNIRFPQEEGRSDWAQVGPFSGKPSWACCLSPRPAPVFLLMASTSPGGPEAGTWHILAPEGTSGQTPWSWAASQSETLKDHPSGASLDKKLTSNQNNERPLGRVNWAPPNPPTAASTHLPPTLNAIPPGDCGPGNPWMQPPRFLNPQRNATVRNLYPLGPLCFGVTGYAIVDNTDCMPTPTALFARCNHLSKSIYFVDRKIIKKVQRIPVLVLSGSTYQREGG